MSWNERMHFTLLLTSGTMFFKFFVLNSTSTISAPSSIAWRSPSIRLASFPAQLPPSSTVRLVAIQGFSSCLTSPCQPSPIISIRTSKRSTNGSIFFTGFISEFTTTAQIFGIFISTSQSPLHQRSRYFIGDENFSYCLRQDKPYFPLYNFFIVFHCLDYLISFEGRQFYR
jgi:hypothetical protein